MRDPSARDQLAERLKDLSERLAKADDFFGHHQSLANNDPCPVESCAHCRKGGPPFTDEHPTFRTASERVALIVSELGEITGIAWSLGYQWDGEQLVPYGDERPEPPISLFHSDPKAFTGTQVQEFGEDFG